MKDIYTIGHSIRPIQVFIDMLQSFSIAVVADIRSFPRSRWQPQYNQKALAVSLQEAGIQYIHIPELGGKSGEQPGFSERLNRGDLDEAVDALTALAEGQSIAYMCAEGDCRNCHRAVLSTHLQPLGWNVLNIMDAGTTQPHEGTKQKRLF